RRNLGRPLQGLFATLVRHAQGAARRRLGDQRAHRPPGLSQFLHARPHRRVRRLPHLRAVTVTQGWAFRARTSPLCCAPPHLPVASQRAPSSPPLRGGEELEAMCVPLLIRPPARGPSLP